MKRAASVFRISSWVISAPVLIFSLFVGKGAEAVAGCKHTKKRFNCVDFVKNYDGDSLTFDISKVHPIIGKQIRVRLAGVNTAERKSLDSCERDVAYRAQAFVKQELSQAKRIDLVGIGRGKYFRVLADVIYDKKSLAETLLHRRLAVHYDGGTKPLIDWCHFF